MATILIVDDHAPNRSYLRTLLKGGGHLLLEAEDGVKALGMISQEAPDLVITDMLMPNMDGAELARTLRLNPDFAQIRIVIYTAMYEEAAARELAKACGVLHFVRKPCAQEILLNVIERALTETWLAPAPVTPQTDEMARRHHQLVTTKLHEKVTELETLNRELERRVEERTGELQNANRELVGEIVRRQQIEEALKFTNQQLREDALQDMLTGLYNRRFLEETLHREITRCKRLTQPLGIMLIDIDHFKRCNDTLGHASGDEVLAAVGKCMQMMVRGADVACRYGGEEFVILMPGAPLEVVRSRAMALCENVRRLEISLHTRQLWSPSVSIGIALLPDNAANEVELLRAADLAMYQAKSMGRDQVVVSGEYPVS